MRPLLAGVLGAPIGHSKSPLIHNFWIKDNNINGLYAPIEVAAEDLEAFLSLAPRLGFVGFNVTIPHKEAAFALCHARSSAAERAGSVNTLAFDGEGRILGDSTDGYGFLANLAEGAEGWRAEGARVAMVGAGGAARAVIAALLDAGAAEIRLANRSRDRAEALQAVFGPKVILADWPVAPAFFSEADLLINATSLGMAGGPEWDWRLPPLDPAAVATDLIYKPLETPFLAAARAAGARCVDGLGMLLHQAAPGFERWFGPRPTPSAALRRLVLETEGALP